MPSGYTAKIQDNPDITLKEFTMACARAMGAMYHLRDYSESTPYQPRVPSDYHKNKATELTEELDHVRRMTFAELLRLIEKKNEDTFQKIKDSEEEKTKTLKGYTSMLLRVQSWIPPTYEHRGLKDFMVSQITDSIKFDCESMGDYYTTMLIAKNPEDYRDELYKNLREDIAYHKKQHDDDVKHCEESNTWVKVLEESLE